MPASGLSMLTREESIEVGLSYEIKITGEVGTTPGRAAVPALLTLFLFWIFLQITARVLDPPFNIIGFIGFLSIITGNGGLEAFIVNVPKYTGLVVTNIFTGTVHVFPPGIHIRFPWEQFHIEDYISVRPDTLQKTTVFRSKDGIPITYTWGITVGPSMRLLAIFIRNPMDTLTNNLTEIGETALAALIGDKTAAEMRQSQTISDICTRLDTSIQTWTDAKGNTIEKRSGASAERATISPPTFGQDYDEATTVEVISSMVNASAKRIVDETGVSPEAALNAVLMMNKEAVKKQINEVTAGKDFIDALRDLGIGAGQVLRGVQRALPPAPPPSTGPQ